MESTAYFLYQLHWYDLLDVLLVTTMVVWLYSWVRGTRAFRVLLGLGLVILIYLWARAWGLFLTQWALQGLGQVVVIAVIILFAPEIRQVLERLNPMRIWNRPDQKQRQDFIAEITRALPELAERRIGALIVLERGDNLTEFVRSGVVLDGQVRHAVLHSLFQPKSPLHDGAVLIKNGLIHQVGVFLPISEREHPPELGSRHRAALGLAEVSDALVLVVSEETGNISLVERQQLSRITDLDQLKETLQAKIGTTPIVPVPSGRNFLLREWKVKLVSLALVTAVWFALASQQTISQSFTVPVESFNLASQYALESEPVREAVVTLSGPRLSLARLNSKSLRIPVNLSGVTPDTKIVPIDPGRILVPPEIAVVTVDPQFISLSVTLIPKQQQSDRQP